MIERTITIFLIEDDEVDIEAIVRAFRKAKIANPFVHARDGIEALEMLEAGIESPFLILLDLNMPRMNGLEFMKALREHPKYKQSIVFVLTTSNSERDRWDAYEHNIAGYLLKSRAGQDFTNVIEMLDIYWRVIEFPPDLEPGAANYTTKQSRAGE